MPFTYRRSFTHRYKNRVSFTFRYQNKVTFIYLPKQEGIYIQILKLSFTYRYKNRRSFTYITTDTKTTEVIFLTDTKIGHIKKYRRAFTYRFIDWSLFYGAQTRYPKFCVNTKDQLYLVRIFNGFHSFQIPCYSCISLTEVVVMHA